MVGAVSSRRIEEKRYRVRPFLYEFCQRGRDLSHRVWRSCGSRVICVRGGGAEAGGGAAFETEDRVGAGGRRRIGVCAYWGDSVARGAPHSGGRCGGDEHGWAGW